MRDVYLEAMKRRGIYFLKETSACALYTAIDLLTDETPLIIFCMTIVTGFWSYDYLP